ncbi:DNA starvation/stationary phase protection protein [Legionella taurinensis]|uniref:DNA starvation/stationary phase protection protein n=1 Tax=Legionella taurinensis TaxID=70611 RepID=A0A3A5LCJ6_9GAMM|nr:DNA starvation/stationary phase protection protein [Legionella taurinensis]MDX1836565.1 DNA starvation/stationary phase protection protein [Legionella taurinensis]PUT42972.1 DNA starvation/stationary phase protection protein [Legionella taurinensis]PUT45527.1 DNA starvation/stationary phase protection protein [Legionella taurinensis]PUT46898.1 DNA starvation/stationary phase protection protein [Legionella taurinensis]PUT49294.1 DNA starvation/stationary phase protection protein [Legionella 
MSIAKELSIILADTYALYLKTQNYHWHVRGPQFKSLHGLFETQYTELAEAVDEVAERLLITGNKAPATFKEFESLKRIKDGDSSLDANQMVIELAQDHSTLVKDLNRALALAQEQNDEGTATLLGDRIAAHEKAHWMLAASAER